MAAYNKFQNFSEELVKGNQNFATDVFKVYLTNATPSASADSVKADLAEISAGNGYTAGGNAATTASSTETSGTYKLVLTSPATWTAAGGSIGPFEYAILYDSTTDNLIGYWDYGSPVTLSVGESFSVVLDGTSGVFTVA